MVKPLLIKDLAEIGGVSLATAKAAFQRGMLPQPTGKARIAPPFNALAWWWEDTPEVRAAVVAIWRPDVDTAGMVPPNELARMTGLTRITLTKFIRKGLLTADTPPVGRHRQGLFRPTPELLAALRKAAEHIAAGGTYLDLPEGVKGVMKSREQKAEK